MEEKKEEKKIYIEKIWRFTCMDCGKTGEYPDKDAARNHGWAVSRGEKTCYCPKHAFAHRNTGCKGVPKINLSVQQIEISEVQNSA